MKRIELFTVMTLMLSFALVSCGALDALKDYEEALSLTIEEEEALLKGKWMLNDAGYSLYLDGIYDVERIDKDGYPEVSSAIESIVIGANGAVTFNFKEPVTFEMNPYQLTGATYETFETYTVTDEVMMRLGFDGEGVEYFLVQEDRAGGVECDFTLYGVEKLNGDYTVNRMIMSAGTVGKEFYYEFIPTEDKEGGASDEKEEGSSEENEGIEVNDYLIEIGAEGVVDVNLLVYCVNMTHIYKYSIAGLEDCTWARVNHVRDLNGNDWTPLLTVDPNDTGEERAVRISISHDGDLLCKHEIRQKSSY